MDETRRVTEILHELAASAPAGGQIPRKLRHRARLAMARTVLAAIAVVGATASGGVAAYHNLSAHRVAPRPATQEPRDVVAYVSDRDGDTDIYTTTIDTSETVNLTDNDASDSSPSWSPDGSQIVFESDRDSQAGLYVMDSDGSNAHRLLVNGVDPDWSPDGSKIAFTRVGTEQDGGLGLSQIFTLDLTTSIVEQVTHDDAGAIHPDWSPDGDDIAYSGQQAHVIVSPASGSNPTELTGEDLDLHPVWSPDGSALMFSRETGFADNVSLSNVFSVDADGNEAPQQITNFAGSAIPTSFSPDGSRLLVTVYDDGTGDVYVMDADGTNASPLVNDPAGEEEAAWRPAS